MEFIKQLSEVLSKFSNANEKMILLEKLLREMKDPEQRDIIKKLMAQVEKDIDEKKNEAVAKAKKLGEIEKILMGDVEKKAPIPVIEEPQNIKSIERELEFVEEEKKPTIEKGLGYLQKTDEAYNPRSKKQTEESYKTDISHLREFKPVEEREFLKDGYLQKEKSAEEALEGYSPQDEIKAKEEYKRKKRV